MELKLPVADSGSYPPIEIQGPNPVCARAMLANVGSPSSEMSAVGRYFYNSVILRERYPKAAEYFHQIAIVEMHHLDTFCRLALLLGADPRLWSFVNNRVTYWTPSCIMYSRELKVMLNYSIKEENHTIAEYRQQAEQLPDACIRAILERIILDEEKHVLIFRRLYQEYCTGANTPGQQSN